MNAHGTRHCRRCHADLSGTRRRAWCPSCVVDGTRDYDRLRIRQWRRDGGEALRRREAQRRSVRRRWAPTGQRHTQLPTAQKLAIWERDAYVCHLCGLTCDPDHPDHAMRPSIDHLIPIADARARGISPQLFEHHLLLATAHRGCNASRGTHSAARFRERVRAGEYTPPPLRQRA